MGYADSFGTPVSTEFAYAPADQQTISSAAVFLIDNQAAAIGRK